ncbi:MAG: tRNA A-37 threonylcarbamoyl transferase component Bud32, partial [Myxococcota bacterium]
MAEARSLRPGDLLGGRFAILGELGRGGSATVYLVDDRVRGERVALKVLHDHLAADPSARRRLRREVLASSRIRHPAALVANELHEVDGRLALSLPYHAGSTVHELVGQSGPLPGATVESIALQLAEVLTASHRAGVLHRDLSPTNVLVSRDGQVALTDFGLARVGEGGTRSTSTLGTSGYSAPEVWEGSRSDPRSDLYSLGAVVYLAATGRGPFAAPTAVASLQRQLDGAHRPLGEARPDLPAHVCQLVDRLLDVDPERRPAGARAVVDALQTRSLQSAPAEVEARPAVAVGPVRWFDEGGWAVVVREDPDDELRRASLRARTGRKPNLVLEAFASVALQVRDALGMPLSSSPEQALIAEVERVAGLPPGALRAPPAVLDQRFKLIDGVDRHTADRLVASAQNAGFRAEAVDEAPARGWWIPARRVPQILGLTWVVFGMMAMVGAD